MAEQDTGSGGSKSPSSPEAKQDQAASSSAETISGPARSTPVSLPQQGRWRQRLLGIDAALDTALWRAGRGLRRWFETYDSFLRNFRARGIWRFLAELGSDAATYGTMGFVVLLAFAQPAMEATRHSDWRTTDDFAVTFLDRFGAEIGRRGIVLNDRVPLEELPDNLIKATLATEDRRFFSHLGIDVIGTFRAIVENARAGGVVQGGSSLTQQLAKNLFLSNERTLGRKIKEAYLAFWLEANLTKQEILKLYLDRAYMGGGVFGVAAAADFYFNKNVRDLSLAESAMLAGLYKAPAKYAPHVNLPQARARANEVLTNMVQAGYLTEGQVIGARRNPAIAVDRSQERLPEYYLDWGLDEVKKLARRIPAMGRDRIVTVRTTFDPALQKQADLAVDTVLRENGKARDVGEVSMTVMTPDGGVVAMVGGSSYGQSQFNRAVNALRQPGSSFKPFVYMTAFLNGYSPASIVPDAPISIGGWSPRNYGRSYRGPVSLKLALTKSINTVPVRLAQAVGRDKIVETAYKMGITNELKISKSLPLGASDVSNIDMTASYASFANGGYRATPYAILEVKNSVGETLYSREDNEPAPKRILPKEQVAQMNDILVNVVQNGTGRRARIDGVVAAGKTGTTSAYRDAWFVGYTGNFVAAVWLGNDDFTSTRRVTGGSLPATIWQLLMDYAHKNTDLVLLPGIDPANVGISPRTAQATSTLTEAAPRLLSRETEAVLRRIEASLETAATTTSQTVLPETFSQAGATSHE